MNTKTMPDIPTPILDPSRPVPETIQEVVDTIEMYDSYGHEARWTVAGSLVALHNAYKEEYTESPDSEIDEMIAEDLSIQGYDANTITTYRVRWNSAGLDKDVVPGGTMRIPSELTMNDVITESQRFQLDADKAGTIAKVNDAYRSECDCVGKISGSEPGVALMQYSDMIEAVVGLTVDDPSLRKAAKRILRDALNELNLIEEDSND